MDGFDGKLNTSKWAKIAKHSTDTALRDIQDLLKKRGFRKRARWQKKYLLHNTWPTAKGGNLNK